MVGWGETQGPTGSRKQRGFRRTSPPGRQPHFRPGSGEGQQRNDSHVGGDGSQGIIGPIGHHGHPASCQESRRSPLGWKCRDRHCRLCSLVQRGLPHHPSLVCVPRRGKSFVIIQIDTERVQMLWGRASPLGGQGSGQRRQDSNP